ncbi:MAG: class I SAM-dependent methyltransferase [Acidobacteria bacterium]|nr:class I SAM-dependent methyltransferase [Acidobacteriota bacterium]
MNPSSRESENMVVLKSLESDYVPEPIRQARERQDAILMERFKGKPIAIADIGCGTGYHGSVFGPGCRLYHGFEISPEIARVAQDRWRKEGLENTALFLGDVTKASPQTDHYDVVWCLYFTPGNFREPSEDLSLYSDAYLDRNPAFIAVFSRFYQVLKPGGSMFLTVYKDVVEAESAQIEFYHHTGQHVVTPRGSRFVATAEHFWSARWRESSLRSNLEACGIPTDRVVLHDLNHIAWLVEITKG